MKVLIEWSLWKAWEILSSQNLCFSDETNRTCSMAPLVLVSWSYLFSGSQSWPLQPAPFLPLWCPEEEENQSCLSKSSTTPHPRLSPCHRVEKTQNQKGQKHHVLFGGLEKQKRSLLHPHPNSQSLPAGQSVQRVSWLEPLLCPIEWNVWFVNLRWQTDCFLSLNSRTLQIII